MKLGEELNARARSRALLAELSAGGDTTNRVSQCDAKPDPLVANPAEVSKPQSLSRIRRSHAVCALGAIRTRDTRFRKRSGLSWVVVVVLPAQMPRLFLLDALKPCVAVVESHPIVLDRLMGQQVFS